MGYFFDHNEVALEWFVTSGKSMRLYGLPACDCFEDSPTPLLATKLEVGTPKLVSGTELLKFMPPFRHGCQQLSKPQHPDR